MKGKVLDFSGSTGQGVIAGDDGQRYGFVASEWKSGMPPVAGARVDFVAQGVAGHAVYLDPATLPHAKSCGTDDLYRSSDDRMIAGVCGGLAHRWRVGSTKLRLATVIVTLFFGLPVVLYVVCWIVFPARPTQQLA